MTTNNFFRCPNAECQHHKDPQGIWFIRKGTFFQKWSRKNVQRFQCKACGTRFSSSSFEDTFRQHKPFLNRPIFKWYSNSASQRQIAENCETTRTTVIRKFRYLADKARQVHAVEMLSGNLHTGCVQFDEQETFLRTKKLPLSIAMAVDGRRIPIKEGGGKIIDINVGTMPAKSRNARSSQEQYGKQTDQRPYVCLTVLNNVKIATGGNIEITTDAKPQYKSFVGKILSKADHVVFNRSEDAKETVNRNEDHPLWYVNQACAATRHDISRLRRRTCVTTKALHEIRRHLWLYVAHRNGYEDDLLDPLFTLTKLRKMRERYVVENNFALAGNL